MYTFVTLYMCVCLCTHTQKSGIFHGLFEPEILELCKMREKKNEIQLLLSLQILMILRNISLNLVKILLDTCNRKPN